MNTSSADFYKTVNKAVGGIQEKKKAEIAAAPKGVAVSDVNDPLAALKQMLGSGAKLSPQLLGALMPNTQSIMGVDKTGKTVIKDPYKLSSAGVDKITAAQNKQIDTNTGHSLDQMMGQTAQAQASAQDQLAQGGGYDAGSAARLAQQGIASKVTGNQDIYAQANEAKANAASQGAGMKFGADQFNVSNAIGDLGNQNAYAYQGWGKLGDIYGSSQIAGAMGGGGGGSGLIGGVGPTNPITKAPAFQDAAPGSGGGTQQTSGNWWQPKTWDLSMSGKSNVPGMVGSGGGGGGVVKQAGSVLTPSNYY